LTEVYYADIKYIGYTRVHKRKPHFYAPVAEWGFACCIKKKCILITSINDGNLAKIGEEFIGLDAKASK